MSQAAMTSRPAKARPWLDWKLAMIGAGVAIFLVWMLLPKDAVSALASIRPHAPRWDLLAQAPLVIRLHVAAAVVAFLVGTVLLLGVKGTALHKALGWTWVVAMGVTAVSSLFIRVINPGHWSYIHFLSGWVIIALPIGVAAIRRKNLRLHRRMMTGLFVGGLLIAGAFTFVPGRLLFQVFLG